MAKLVYVVDDEQLLLELAENILRSRGYNVLTFKVPEEAIESLATAAPKPDLLITDYAMGTLNGLQLIEKCKALQPALKTMLCSGTVVRGVMDEAAVKADEFLPKPYRVADFLAMVRRLAGEA